MKSKQDITWSELGDSSEPNLDLQGCHQSFATERDAASFYSLGWKLKDGSLKPWRKRPSYQSKNLGKVPRMHKYCVIPSLKRGNWKSG